jgi:sialate O-acetylesterase
MRWAQTQIGRTVPNSGTAVTIDVGDHGDIHPKNKRAVGERLAALALAQTYGRKDQALSPVPADEAAHPVNDSGEVWVGFVDPVTGKSAALKKGAVKGFQISRDGKTFEWTQATCIGDAVIVGDSASVPAQRPVRVRYAWDDYPDCDLVSAAGLPVGPFELPVEPK